jgi:phosphomannomutase
MEMLSKKGKKMSEILAPLEAKYFISGEVNSKVADPKVVMQKLAEKYKDAKQHSMDGISIDYPTWHFNVRGSNTEPLIRLNLEAKTKEEMEKRRDEVLQVIRG